MPGCGIPIAAFHQPICYPLSLPTLFMVQECCDLHDCLRDGNGNAGKSNEARSLERRGIGKTPMDVSDAACANHGKLTRPFPPANPVRIGKKPVPGKITTRWQQRKFNLTQFPRQPGVKDGCKDKGSWRIIHTYTKPSTLSTVVSERLDGGRKGGHLQVSTARADAWTSTITVSAQLNFGFTKFRRALFPGGNFGSTRSEAHSCTITDTKTFWIDVEEQRSGQMAWTGYHECEVGRCPPGPPFQQKSPRRPSRSRTLTPRQVSTHAKAARWGRTRCVFPKRRATTKGASITSFWATRHRPGAIKPVVQLPARVRRASNEDSGVGRGHSGNRTFSPASVPPCTDA